MTWKRSEIRQARTTPLKPVLEDLGYELAPLRNGNYLLRRLATEIVVKDHFWVCRDEATATCVRKAAGNAIDFLVEVQTMSFNQAMHLLLSYHGTSDTAAVGIAGAQNNSSDRRHRTEKGAL